MNTSTAALTVGDRFETDVEMPFTTDGVKSVHTFTKVCEVTGVDEVGFSYKVLEVTNEKSRPAFATTPVEGTIAWFVVPIYVSRGTMRIGG